MFSKFKLYTANEDQNWIKAFLVFKACRVYFYSIKTVSPEKLAKYFKKEKKREKSWTKFLETTFFVWRGKTDLLCKYNFATHYLDCVFVERCPLIACSSGTSPDTPGSGTWTNSLRDTDEFGRWSSNTDTDSSSLMIIGESKIKLSLACLAVLSCSMSFVLI